MPPPTEPKPPNKRDAATLVGAAVIYALSAAGLSPSEAFEAAALFIEEADKRYPGLIDVALKS